jgi:hypothetical protein
MKRVKKEKNRSNMMNEINCFSAFRNQRPARVFYPVVFLSFKWVNIYIVYKEQPFIVTYHRCRHYLPFTSDSSRSKYTSLPTSDINGTNNVSYLGTEEEEKIRYLWWRYDTKQKRIFFCWMSTDRGSSEREKIMIRYICI